MDEHEKQNMREFVVLHARDLGITAIEDLESMDRAVCLALELDPDEVPPEFIFDAPL